MSDHGQDVVLQLPVYIDVDLDIDADGICSIVTLLFENDDDDPRETSIELESVVEAVTEYYAHKAGYQKLYCLAHEFSRMAEIMRENACLIEDSNTVVQALFDLND